MIKKNKRKLNIFILVLGIWNIRFLLSISLWGGGWEFWHYVSSSCRNSAIPSCNFPPYG